MTSKRSHIFSNARGEANDVRPPVIERFAYRARFALLPNQPFTESIPGLQLLENLNELEIQVKGDHVLRVNYAVDHLPTGIEGMSTYDHDREEILITLNQATYLALVEGSSFDSRLLLFLRIWGMAVDVAP
jgi:hypothetical protein